MMVCLFWAAALACDMISARQEGPKAQRIWMQPHRHLLVFFLVAAILYFGHCIYFNRLTALLPLADALYVTANLAVYPLYYLYICSLTARKGTVSRRYLILLPALVGGILTATLYLLMSPQQTAAFIGDYMYHDAHDMSDILVAAQILTHDVCKFAFAVLVVIVLVYGRRRVMQYEAIINNNYADTENKSLVSLHHLLQAFIVTSIASIVCNMVGRHQFTDSQWTLSLPSVLFSVLLFAIGYIGFRTEFSIRDVELDEQGDSPDAGEREEDSDISQLRQSIEQLMTEKQLFLKQNLKVADLSQQLCTNRNYIYQAINREMGFSFSDYINRLRIDYARTMIDRNPKMPLMEVAEQSGFCSRTSFYRNFKQQVGMSPKEYQDKVR